MIRYRVAIIGCGAIGRRHLESLLKFKKKIEIYLIDKSFSALNLSKKIISKSKKKHDINYLLRMDMLPKKIDLAIIATTSDVRKDLTIKLLKQANLKYIIFEKFVFQSIQDFKKINFLLKKHKVKSWVNTSHRLNQVYKKIKKHLKNKIFRMQVEGSNWSMGSNSIHWLDLFVFLTNQKKIIGVYSKLKKKIYSSKRKGFVEFGGEFEIKNKHGSSLRLLDDRAKKKLPNILFDYKNERILIDQNQRTIKYFDKKKMILTCTEKFSLLLQSNLTHNIVKKKETLIFTILQSARHGHITPVLISILRIILWVLSFSQ